LPIFVSTCLCSSRRVVVGVVLERGMYVPGLDVYILHVLRSDGVPSILTMSVTICCMASAVAALLI
jgi:hypothetical protein